MNILTEYNKSYSVDSYTEVMVPRYFWCFSAMMLDYKLFPLNYLEETTSPVFTVEINGHILDIPTSWTILIVDKETSLIDTVPVEKCVKLQTYAYLMSPSDFNVNIVPIKYIDYKDDCVVVNPQVSKGTGFCHPVGNIKNKKEEFCITLSPYDLHKFLVNKTVGNLLSN